MELNPYQVVGTVFVFEIEDIEATVTMLKGNGMKFKNEIIRGGGRAQILCEDPSGNVIELMQRANACCFGGITQELPCQ